MKKILIFCMVFTFIISGIASAKVSKGIDGFTNELATSSYTYPEHFFDILYFNKEMSGGVATYEIKISKTTLQEYLLADIPIEVKVDKHPVVVLEQYRYKVISKDNYNVDYESIITAKFSAELADSIKDAKRVALRYQGKEGLSHTYVLPSNVLAEWQEVINTTE